GAVHDLGPVGKAGRRIDEAAETDHANDLVEVAKRGLDLRQQVDGAGARGLLSVFDADAAAKLPLGDQLAVAAEADLAGDDEHVSAAHEGDIIGDRRGRLGQRYAERGELLFNRSGHVNLRAGHSFNAFWLNICLCASVAAIARGKAGLYLAAIVQLSSRQRVFPPARRAPEQ